MGASTTSTLRTQLCPPPTTTSQSSSLNPDTTDDTYRVEHAAEVIVEIWGATSTLQTQPSLPPRSESPSSIITKSNNPTEIKRAKNTLAARRYRRRFVQQIEDAKMEIKYWQRQTMIWQQEAGYLRTRCEEWEEWSRTIGQDNKL